MKARNDKVVPEADELREHYSFDYSQAELNRFADRFSQEAIVVVLDPDVAAVLETIGRIMVSEGWPELAGRKASWFGDAAGVVEGVGSDIMKQNDFEIALNNYRDGVQKTLPAYLSGKMAGEEAWVDELALLLHSRDELEWAFAGSPSPQIGGIIYRCKIIL